MTRPFGVLRLAGLVAVGAALWGTASCGTAPQPRPAAETSSAATAAAAPVHADCRGFSLSLVSDRGGQPTPVAAAVWFAAHGGVGDVPRSGWHEEGPDETGVVLRSGLATVHVIQGSDRTWQVDSGQSC